MHEIQKISFFILGYISDKPSIYPDSDKVLLAQEVLSNSVANQLEVLRRNSEEFRMSLWLEHITRATQVIIFETCALCLILIDMIN